MVGDDFRAVGQAGQSPRGLVEVRFGPRGDGLGEHRPQAIFHPQATGVALEDRDVIFREAKSREGRGGLRRGKTLDLTVAMPLLAGLIGSEQDYFARKEALLAEMRDFAAR